jgi:hypothetical protein
LDRLIKTIGIALLMIINNFASAQNSTVIKSTIIGNSSNESIFIHLNTTTLLVGEKLYCKLYCLNTTTNKQSTLSKIAYISLVNSDNQAIFTNKIYLDNGEGQGDFFMPTTLSTGNYKLITYTKLMLNKNESKKTETDLFIINPYVDNERSVVTNSSAVAIKGNETAQKEVENTKNLKGDTFAIELDKKTKANREQITFKIKSLANTPKKGNYSLSVRKIDNLPNINQKNALEYQQTNETSSTHLNKNLLYVPELRGEIITGTITNNKDSKELNNKTIALSIPGKSFAVKIVKTNQLGQFKFILDKDPNNSNVVIQIMENDKENYKIELDKDNGFNESELKFTNKLKLTLENKNTLEERSIANQIENAYYVINKDSIILPQKTDPFYHPLEKEYILDDYTRFPSLKETITEVLKEIYYRQTNNNYSIHIRDPHYDLKNFDEPTLVLVDGLVIQDINELFDYRAENIYKVSLVTGVYFYGPKAFNGIVNITTKNNDYQSKVTGNYILKTEIVRPLNKSIYYSPDYSNKTKYERIPDYRYQLLWLPKVTLSNTENPISFYTSDVTGTFEISLEGFTDQGIPVSLKDTFEVQ